MKKIVITRPLDQGRAFADCCAREIGVGPSGFLFEPLLDIRDLGLFSMDPRLRGDAFRGDGDDVGGRGDDGGGCKGDDGARWDDIDGVIITSIHALSALPDNLLHVPVYCVGESVRVALLEKGVSDIVMQPTAADLAEEIIAQNSRGQLHFQYFRGKHIAFDMKGALEQHGHTIEGIITYDAVAATQFSDNFLTVLQNKEIAAITFFSKRTAEIFVRLARDSDILDNLKGIRALCIAPRVVESLYPVFGKNIDVADSPDSCGMLQLCRSFL